MERRITAIVAHMSNSHMQMAHILDSKKHMTAHTAGLVHAIPDHETTFSGAEAITDNALTVSKSVAGYLSSIADLEDAMADTLSEVMKELKDESEE
jgi:hypothetical protein